MKYAFIEEKSSKHWALHWELQDKNKTKSGFPTNAQSSGKCDIETASDDQYLLEAYLLRMLSFHPLGALTSFNPQNKPLYTKGIIISSFQGRGSLGSERRR